MKLRHRVLLFSVLLALLSLLGACNDPSPVPGSAIGPALELCNGRGGVRAFTYFEDRESCGSKCARAHPAVRSVCNDGVTLVKRL